MITAAIIKQKTIKQKTRPKKIHRAIHFLLRSFAAKTISPFRVYSIRHPTAALFGSNDAERPSRAQKRATNTGRQRLVRKNLAQKNKSAMRLQHAYTTHCIHINAKPTATTLIGTCCRRRKHAKPDAMTKTRIAGNPDKTGRTMRRQRYRKRYLQRRMQQNGRQMRRLTRFPIFLMP